MDVGSRGARDHGRQNDPRLSSHYLRAGRLVTDSSCAVYLRRERAEYARHQRRPRPLPGATRGEILIWRRCSPRNRTGAHKPRYGGVERESLRAGSTARRRAHHESRPRPGSPRADRTRSRRKHPQRAAHPLRTAADRFAVPITGPGSAPRAQLLVSLCWSRREAALHAAAADPAKSPGISVAGASYPPNAR